MTQWLYEDGIGEERAILVRDGQILDALIVREDRRYALGAIVAGRIDAITNDGARAWVKLDGGGLALLQPLPAGYSQGARVRGEVVREALVENGPASRRSKPARLRPVHDDTALCDAPRLFDRLRAGPIPVEHCYAHEADRLGEAGWHELVEEATTGLVAFAGGTLQISPTPAMTVIDIDGDLPPRALALAAAPAVAAAIARLGLTGSIAIDFPTLADKAGRQAIAEAFDRAMIGPHERTSINGFGLMQVVRRRERPSLVELFAADPVHVTLMEIVRRAERDRGTGPLDLALAPEQTRLFNAHPEWRERLERRIGRVVQS